MKPQNTASPSSSYHYSLLSDNVTNTVATSPFPIQAAGNFFLIFIKFTLTLVKKFFIYD